MAGNIEVLIVDNVKVIILRTAGTNCDKETAYAFSKTGCEINLVHINQLFREEVKLDSFDILAIPGGFSYGDDISAGKILANELKYKLYKDIVCFARSCKPVIGICNGFQVLVKAGILPGFDIIDKRQMITLTYNDSGKFEDRWVYLDTGKVKKSEDSKVSPCIWTKNLPDIIYLPVAHGEGKFIAGDDEVLAKIEKERLVVFRYVSKDGKRSSYPFNPNGSQNDIAGICNPLGNVLGMMPHPERYIIRYQHPRWTREDLHEQGVGLAIFKNGAEWAKTLKKRKAESKPKYNGGTRK